MRVQDIAQHFDLCSGVVKDRFFADMKSLYGARGWVLIIPLWIYAPISDETSSVDFILHSGVSIEVWRKACGAVHLRIRVKKKVVRWLDIDRSACIMVL